MADRESTQKTEELRSAFTEILNQANLDKKCIQAIVNTTKVGIDGELIPHFDAVDEAKPWDPSMMDTVQMYVPDWYYDERGAFPQCQKVMVDPTFETAYPRDLKQTENEGFPNDVYVIPKEWRFHNWAMLYQQVKKNQVSEIKNYIPYYCALHSTTHVFGSPLNAPFMIYVKHLLRVHSQTNTGGHSDPGEAETGYGLWLIAIRASVKSSAEISETSRMFDSVNGFLKEASIEDLRAYTATLTNAIRSYFSPGSTALNTEVLIRKGMNITIGHHLELEANGDVTLNEVKLAVTKVLNHDHFPNGSFKDKQYIPNIDENFWAFAQIGFDRHGYSAMEQIDTVLRKKGKTYEAMYKYFHSPLFIKFVAIARYEKEQFSLDPWRPVSHLLRRDILCPLSSSKWPEISYVGTCMNTPALDYNSPPAAMNQINLTLEVEKKIAYRVARMLNDWSGGLLEDDSRVKEILAAPAFSDVVFDDEKPTATKTLAQALSNMSSQKQQPPAPSTSSEDPPIDLRSLRPKPAPAPGGSTTLMYTV